MNKIISTRTGRVISIVRKSSRSLFLVRADENFLGIISNNGINDVRSWMEEEKIEVKPRKREDKARS